MGKLETITGILQEMTADELLEAQTKLPLLIQQRLDVLIPKQDIRIVFRMCTDRVKACGIVRKLLQSHTGAFVDLGDVITHYTKGELTITRLNAGLAIKAKQELEAIDCNITIVSSALKLPLTLA